MSALTGYRPTDQYGGEFAPIPNRYYYPAAANVNIFQGAAVALDSSGNANPGGNASGSYVAVAAVGRADEPCLNDPGIAGALSVTVRQGAFKWDVSGTLAQSAVGTKCYQVDDHTVAASNAGGNVCVAGMFMGYDLTDPNIGATVQAIVLTIGAGMFGVLT